MSKIHSKQEYHSSIISKLNDKQLGENLKSCMDTLKNNRAKLIKTKFYDWEGLREQGRKVKQKALSKLPELLQRFEVNATKNGMKIYWANNGDDANNIILKLMKEKNIDTILKGKSMASEEIHLNAFLKKNNINAVETDLGELIIQLIDEAPVHIVAPAIHKNRNQIGKIFEEKLHANFTNVPEELNATARKHLRSQFEGFKMGLTGCNFAIANEGAIWLLENEGNGRMSSSACDIHVVICGIEKVVENFEDASILDTLLVPSATGASITCYNNIISSPRKLKKNLNIEHDELDGPKEVHVILLDNNRSNMLAQKEYYKALSCIRCGTCLNHCPVYDKIGGHAYLSTYPGPIGEVISPQIFGLDTCSDITNLCSLCGRCAEVCPVKIPLDSLIRDLRSEKVGQGRMQIVGYQNTKKDEKEQFAMRQFMNMATNGTKWRFVMNSISYIVPILNFGIKKSFLQKVINLTPLGAWLQNHAMPDINSSLHAKIKKMRDVKYV